MSTSRETDPAFGELVPRRLFGSLISTTRDVLFSPQRFFDWLPPDGPAGPPSLYFVICYFVVSLINLLATAPLLTVPVILAASANPSGTRSFAFFTLTFIFVFLVVLPVLSVGLFFVDVAVQHGFVLLVAGRNQRGLRVSCYSVGAAVLVAWIPIVGLVAVLYCWYLYTIGLRRRHGISTVRAVIAVLIPTMLSLALAAVGIFFGFKALQETFDEPTSYYFPEPEASEYLPSGVVGVAALMDGSRDQVQVRNLRKGSYADVAPGTESGAIVYFVTADPKDGPREWRASLATARARRCGSSRIPRETERARTISPTTPASPCRAPRRTTTKIGWFSRRWRSSSPSPAAVTM